MNSKSDGEFRHKLSPPAIKRGYLLMRQERFARWLIALLATACLICARPGHAQSSFTNLILNGSFEMPVITANSTLRITPTDWSWISAVGDIFNGNNGSIWPLAEDGVQYVDIGNATIYGVSQTVMAPEAGNYLLTWYDSTANEVAQSPYTVMVTCALGTNFSMNLNANHSPAATWLSHSVEVVLPAGTNTLTFQAQGVTGGLDALIDNVSLTFASCLPILSITNSGAQVAMAWNCATGYTYQLQYNGDLTSTDWINLNSPQTATATNLTATDSNTNSQRFYRVLVPLP